MRDNQTNYTEEQLKKYLSEDTVKGKLDLLYKEYYIIKSISVEDKKEVRIYDFIAKWLLKNNVKELYEKNVDQISRHDYGKEYWKERKLLTDKEIKTISKQKRFEEWFAKSLIGKKGDDLGIFINYQIPIKGKKKDKAGKVDLLAYNESLELLSLIELKREDNSETMLRAILEICTYYYQINKEQLKKELKEKGVCHEVSDIQKIVLVFKDSYQIKQYRETESIRDLADELGVKIFIVENKPIITKDTTT
ncbi:MAG: hypothetical protein FWF38_01960 [Spirochaetaceae bacterium]|nr:hypothetical protein [Spirochaetaceae bacterium]